MVQREVREELKNIYSKGNVTLFLGAGVSAGNGLPDWNELVTSLFFRYMMQEEWERIKPYPNYLRAVSQWYINHLGEALDIIVRGLKTGWDKSEYSSTIWDALYSSIASNEKYNVENMLLGYIRDQVIDERKKIKSIITYNYDDLLERSLKTIGYQQFQSVYSFESFSAEIFPIYHVHGYIPYEDNSEKKAYGQVILSEEDYNAVVSDSNYWGNVIQLTTLASSTNVMIGLSLTDRNLRRILDLINKQPLSISNYVFLKRKIPPQLTSDEIENIHLAAMAIIKKWKMNANIKDEGNRLIEIPAILEGVVSNYRDNEIRVFEQLKVTPIWYDDYNDIAAYLHYMKKDSE